jgi:hypothetical protein
MELLSIDIQMTWSQAFSYASKSGYTLYLILALTCLVVAIGILVKVKSQFKIIAFGVMLMCAGAAIVFKPGSIKFNNEFKMEKPTFDYYKNQSATLTTFWDSLYNNTRLIGASNK